MNKKAAELSLTVIIVVIILLVLLVVVVVIFGSKMNVFGKTTVNCNAQGGKCFPTQTYEGRGESKVPLCEEPGSTTIRNTNCPEGQACCLPVLADFRNQEE